VVNGFMDRNGEKEDSLVEFEPADFDFTGISSTADACS